MHRDPGEPDAGAAWAHRRPADDLMGYDWAVPAGAGEIESFAAACGVAIQAQAALARR